jgi:hypothetical protein
MPKSPNDERALEMYRLYCQGLSLSQVAAHYGVTRQSVYEHFARRGWELRSRPAPRPWIEFNGRFYTLRNTGYYGCTTEGRQLLHRDVWEYHNGSIPKGWDIHHIDNNRSNNAIENLECLPKPEHTRRYSPHNNQYTRGRKRRESA